jgi:hypothetical protein
MAAVTVYGLGKTFYWPTMLGVISERFPKGGALALGISGGIGMISAGLLGAPGIGYNQDYFAVQKLQELKATDTYDRYMARTEEGKPETKGFPVITQFYPEFLPQVAGLDNAKLKVFDDYDQLKDKEKGKTTLESDLATLQEVKKKGEKVEAKLETNLTTMEKWWQEQGKPHFTEDKPNLEKARLYGAQHALLYTAFVPAGMAIGFLLLILVFAGMGGYRQVHLETAPTITGGHEA